jgi:hypothetical protein
LRTSSAKTGSSCGRRRSSQRPSAPPPPSAHAQSERHRATAEELEGTKRSLSDAKEELALAREMRAQLQAEVATLARAARGARGEGEGEGAVGMAEEVLKAMEDVAAKSREVERIISDTQQICDASPDELKSISALVREASAVSLYAPLRRLTDRVYEAVSAVNDRADAISQSPKLNIF